ncbi:MAG: hypothetical protein KatS3mg050_2994 [Litorilinea sp.]|nr:MAG: hypothetical protein KatS3mg050_2994 [Litorilinea sp.]
MAMPIKSLVNQPTALSQSRQGASSSEVNRLLSAALVSRRFCHLLLTDPAAALAAGYNGEHFDLTPEERARILAIQAKSLQDFAAQLLDLVAEQAADEIAGPDLVYSHSGMPARIGRRPWLG